MRDKIILGSLIAAALIVGVLVFNDFKQNISKKEVAGEATRDNASSPATSAKVQIEEIVEGEGEEVKSGDTVVMHYKGTLEDGTQFDSSYDRSEPFTTRIGVGDVIQGWDQGVPGMKVGGKRKLTIPPELGYGSADMGNIPPNSTLIFEVELLEIQ